MERRFFLTGGASLAGLTLAGCSAAQRNARAPIEETGSRPPTITSPPPQVVAMYGPIETEQFPIKAVDLSRIPEQFWRQRVRFQTNHRPGTILVNTRTFFLHLVEPGGSAMRYGVGLGRAGFMWSGRGVIEWKRAWPRWTPPQSMIERQPELEQWSLANGGMDPGPENPLGARALYIFQNGRDTLYRIHGTPFNRGIGRAVSSGCVRMVNQDVIDLYTRVRPGATLIVS